MKLRDYRHKRNLKLEAAAAELGFTAPSLSRYETGKRMPRKAEMDRIRAWSGGAVTPNDFHDDLPSGNSTSPEASPAGGNPSPSAGAPVAQTGRAA